MDALLPEAEVAETTAPDPMEFPSRVAAVADRMICPACGPAHESPLEPAASALRCTRCGARYARRGAVPILLTAASRDAHGPDIESDTGRAMQAEYRTFAASPAPRRWADRVRPPGLMLHLNPRLDAANTRPLFSDRGPGTRILNVGGGPTRYSPQEVTLNLDAFPNVDVVGDAHLIPFAADTFDSIICNAVLEHVHAPETVVAEMVRVLRPGGLLYAEVPFIFFFHGYPSDFRRYTLEGMRRLFGGLDGLELGITNGPVSATLQTLNTLLQVLLPARRPRLLKAVRGVFGWTVFPLKHLDRRLSRRADAHLIAGGFFALGRKPSP